MQLFTFENWNTQFYETVLWRGNTNDPIPLGPWLFWARMIPIKYENEEQKM